MTFESDDNFGVYEDDGEQLGFVSEALDVLIDSAKRREQLYTDALAKLNETFPESGGMADASGSNPDASQGRVGSSPTSPTNLSFPNRPLIPTRPAVFDDHE